MVKNPKFSLVAGPITIGPATKLNYDKKCCYQLLPQNAPQSLQRAFFEKSV